MPLLIHWVSKGDEVSTLLRLSPPRRVIVRPALKILLTDKMLFKN